MASLAPLSSRAPELDSILNRAVSLAISNDFGDLAVHLRVLFIRVQHLSSLAKLSISPELIGTLDKALLNAGQDAKKRKEEEERAQLIRADCVILLSGLTGLLDIAPPSRHLERIFPHISAVSLKVISGAAALSRTAMGIDLMKTLQRVFNDVILTVKVTGMASSDFCLEFEEVLRSLVLLEQVKNTTAVNATTGGSNQSSRSQGQKGKPTGAASASDVRDIAFVSCNCLIEVLTERHRILDSGMLTSGVTQTHADDASPFAKVDDEGSANSKTKTRREVAAEVSKERTKTVDENDSLGLMTEGLITFLARSTYPATHNISLSFSNVGIASPSITLHLPLYCLLRILQINALSSKSQLNRYRDMFAKYLFLIERTVETLYRNPAGSKQLIEIVDELICAVSCPTLLVSRELVKSVAKVSVKMLSGGDIPSFTSSQLIAIANCQGLASNCLIKLIPLCQHEIDSSAFGKSYQADELEETISHRNKSDMEDATADGESGSDEPEGTQEGQQQLNESSNSSETTWRCTGCENVWLNGTWLRESGKNICVLCRIRESLDHLERGNFNTTKFDTRTSPSGETESASDHTPTMGRVASNSSGKGSKGRRNIKKVEIEDSDSEEDVTSEEIDNGRNYCNKTRGRTMNQTFPDRRGRGFLHGFDDNSFIVLNALILSDYERMLGGSVSICALKASCVFNKNLILSPPVLQRLLVSNSVHEFLSLVRFTHKDDVSTAVQINSETTGNSSETANAFAGRLEKVLLACQPHILNVETLGGVLLMLSVSKKLNLVNRAKVIRDLSTLTQYLPKRQTVFCCVKGLLDPSVIVREASLCLALKLVELDLRDGNTDLRSVLLQSILRLAVSCDNPTITGQIIGVVANLIVNSNLNDPAIIDFTIRFLQIPRCSLLFLSNSLLPNTKEYIKYLEDDKAKGFNAIISLIHFAENTKRESPTQQQDGKTKLERGERGANGPTALNLQGVLSYFLDLEWQLDSFIALQDKYKGKTFTSYSTSLPPTLNDASNRRVRDDVTKTSLSPIYIVLLSISITSMCPPAAINLSTSMATEYNDLGVDEISKKKSGLKAQKQLNVALSLDTQINILFALLHKGLVSKDIVVISRVLSVLELYLAFEDTANRRGSDNKHQGPLISKLKTDVMLSLTKRVSTMSENCSSQVIANMLKILKLYLDTTQSSVKQPQAEDTVGGESRAQFSITGIRSNTVTSPLSTSTLCNPQLTNNAHNPQKLTLTETNKLLFRIIPFLQHEAVLPSVVPVIARLNGDIMVDAISSYAETILEVENKVQELWDQWSMAEYGNRFNSLLFFNFMYNPNGTAQGEETVQRSVLRLNKLMTNLQNVIYFISVAVRHSVVYYDGSLLHKAESRTVILDEEGPNSLIDAVFEGIPNSLPTDTFGAQETSPARTPGLSPNTGNIGQSPEELQASPSTSAGGSKLYIVTRMDIEFIALITYKCIMLVQRAVESLLTSHTMSPATIQLLAKFDQLHGQFVVSYSNFAAVFPFLITSINIYTLPSEALELTMGLNSGGLGGGIKEMIKENKASLTKIRPRLMALYNPRLYISLIHSSILSLSDVGDAGEYTKTTLEHTPNTESHDVDDEEEETPSRAATQLFQQPKPTSALSAASVLVSEVGKALSPKKDSSGAAAAEDSGQTNTEGLRVMKIALLKVMVSDNLYVALGALFERFTTIDLDKAVGLLGQVAKSIRNNSVGMEEELAAGRESVECELDNSFLTATIASSFVGLANTITSIGLVHPQQVFSMVLGVFGAAVLSNSSRRRPECDMSFLQSLTPSIADLLSKYPAECVAVNAISRGLELIPLLAYRGMSSDVVIKGTLLQAQEEAEGDAVSNPSLLVSTRLHSFIQLRSAKDVYNSDLETAKITQIPFMIADSLFNIFGAFFRPLAQSATATASSTTVAPTIQPNTQSSNTNETAEQQDNGETDTTGTSQQTNGQKGQRGRRAGTFISKKPQIVLTAFVRALQTDRLVSLFTQPESKIYSAFNEHHRSSIAAARDASMALAGQNTSLSVFDIPNVFFNINCIMEIFITFATAVSLTNTKYRDTLTSQVERLWNEVEGAVCTEGAGPLIKLLSVILVAVLGYLKTIQIQQQPGKVRSRPTRMDIETDQYLKALRHIENLCKVGCRHYTAIVTNRLEGEEDKMGLVIEYIYNLVVTKSRCVPPDQFFEGIFAGDLLAVIPKPSKKKAAKKAAGAKRPRKVDSDGIEDVEDANPPGSKRTAL